MAEKYDVNFQRLKHSRECVGQTCLCILDLLEPEPGSPPPTNLEEKAEDFVNRLVKFPSFDKLRLHPDDFVWSFWEALLDIASDVSPCSPEQDVLVKSVLLLEAIGNNEKPEEKMWKNLPDFGIAVRESWNRSPTTGNGKDDKPADEYTELEWLNLNSFMARLHASQKGGWGPFPIWQLREGLESPLSPKDDIPTPNTRVRIAAEWILRSSHRLFIDSLLHSYSDDLEGPETGRPYHCGPLYSGKSHYSVERWCFWKSRLSDIRTEISEDLHPVLDEAIKTMNTTEREHGERLEYVDDPGKSKVKSKAKAKTRAKARARAKAKAKAKEEIETEAGASSSYTSDGPVAKITDEGDISYNDNMVHRGNAIKAH
ncbi:hypothetical protein F4774DRAFT_371320 [Daldinia eschscholtzii]|nr:hypothetical protein F4774DRAFT_371320 [Daldinia eschscholtzii]